MLLWVLPRLEVVLIANPGTNALGAGGPPMLAPALANAICDAAGARVLQLPMTPERVKTALV